MIKIIKDKDILSCSIKTYESMYKRLGYEILEDKKEAKVEVKVEEIKEDKKENKVQDIIKEDKKVINNNDKKGKNRNKNKKGE